MHFTYSSTLRLALCSLSFCLGTTAVQATAASTMAPLPPARSSHDALPPVPKVHPIEDLNLVQQAGVGSDVSYGRSGVLELGGSFNMNGIGDQSNISLTPSIGWFVMDNFELSGLVRLTNSSFKNSKTLSFTALIEPSVHLPVTEQFFVFGGLGVGGAYSNGLGGGVAIEPRLGGNITVGRSGILTPSVGYNWTSTRAEKTAKGTTLLAFQGGFTSSIGYSVMW